jgi:streptomycin 6-kinase
VIHDRPVAREVEVPDAVRVTARAAGAHGERWLRSLGGLLDELEGAWDVSIGSTMTGGTAGLVAEATRADGTPAVVKLAMPDPSEGRLAMADEARVLRMADGRGCVRLLAYDPDREAVLLERLGRQVHELGLPVTRQIEVICAALREVWGVEVADDGLPTLEEKGRWLADFITTTDEALGNPCSRLVIDRALELAERRVAQCDPERAVLLHGDAHAWNTLEDPTRDDAFRLVDPDGVVGEPEYDLAIPMREFTDELMAGDALRIGQDRARFLAHHTGLDAVRIWEWGYIERVSTGLLCVAEGHEAGRDFLTVAEAWSRA